MKKQLFSNGSTTLPGGSFRRKGPLHYHGLHPNRTRWRSADPMLAARMFVGFNVADEPTYSIDHLIGVVRDARTLQGREPSSSFLYQRGIYAHEAGGDVVEEDGAQVIILNTSGLPAEAFRTEMLEVAEQIARKMDQEEVIVELQRGGVTEEVIGVGG